MGDLLQQWFDEGRFTLPAVPIARMRRGKRVVIPPEWRGKTVDGNQKRKRLSRVPRKMRRGARNGYIVSSAKERLSRQERRAPTVDEWDD